MEGVTKRNNNINTKDEPEAKWCLRLILAGDEGTSLQLIGRAEILWDMDDAENETGGTLRFLKFHIEHWFEIKKAHEIEWSFLDHSPYNPKKINRAQNIHTSPHSQHKKWAKQINAGRLSLRHNEFSSFARSEKSIFQDQS